MKSTVDIGTLRDDYLDVLKELALLLIQRGSANHHAVLWGNADPDEQKQIASLTERCGALANRMRIIERQAQGKLGCHALFGPVDIPPVLRLAVAVLAMKGLAHSVASECRTVSMLAELVAGKQAAEMLTVREAFKKKGGILRPHIHIEMERVLDEAENPTLTEAAFRTFLGLEQDAECAEWVRARELMGVPQKRRWL